MNITTAFDQSALKAATQSRVNELELGAQAWLSLVEHVCALNLNAARAALDEVEASSRAVFAAREPEALLGIEFDLANQAQQQLFAYGRGLAGVAATAHGEASKLAEFALSQWLQGLIIGLDHFNRSLPQGAGMAANLASRSAQLSASQVLSAYEQLVKIGTGLKSGEQPRM